ncbi:hypothetical protein ACM39_08495 [Chryseobacterium sp. FH2]|uniref:hypothetical protein n=1 Tax=Chryseobacterium sp. FH2 TaxID=1674291 RepID=UPI00065AA7DC|nr:hypothetical protein [Chryseobacterium sp. FH2]KMQ68533.1 hypothetical protein ACM39_08495 [Chryseobacterium sp. FH2]
MENMLENKDIINRYLALNIKIQFDLDFDLKDEYIFTQNIVSKKMIIATTFSDKILFNPQIKVFLAALITEINNGNCTIENIKDRLKHTKEMNLQHIKKIV